MALVHAAVAGGSHIDTMRRPRGYGGGPGDGRLVVDVDSMIREVAASSELTPRAIAAQNGTRCCRHATVGRPGDGI